MNTTGTRMLAHALNYMNTTGTRMLAHALNYIENGWRLPAQAAREATPLVAG